MESEPNPYQAPQAQPRTSWLWDRSASVQVAVGMHLLVLVAYCVFAEYRDSSLFTAIGSVDLAAQVAAGTCTTAASALLLVSTITMAEWPLRLRSCLIVIDAIVVALIGFVSNGFDLL